MPAESKQNYIKGRMLPLKEANVVFALHTQLLLQLVVHTHTTLHSCAYHCIRHRCINALWYR